MKEVKFLEGIEEYRLNDKVSVYFNPTDTTFIGRLFDVFKQLDEHDAVFRARVESAITTEETLDTMKEADADLRKLLDTVFENPICDELFGKTNVYAMAGGLPIWANLILAIVDEIDASFVNEQKQTNPRLTKYLSKYKNGAV